MKAQNKVADHLSYHAAQLPVLGKRGQERLHHACVHICGVGRIGGHVVTGLAEAGLGRISADDFQRVAAENIGPWAFAMTPDLGKEKVVVLARFLEGRPDLVYVPLVEPVESRKVDPYIRQADLMISCANTVEGRLTAERKAIRYRRPVMQVALFDGRERLGGLITLRLPENRWSACFGCCLGGKREFPRGEGLLSTASSTLAAVAANMAVGLLTGVRAGFLRQHNLFWIDLERYRIEALSVRRSAGCKICGRA